MRLGRMSVCTPAAGQLELHNGLYRAQYTQRGPESAAPVLLGGRVPRQRHTTCRRPARGSGSCRVGCARWPRRPAGASCDRMCNGESARQVVGAGLCRLRLCRTASRAALRWGPPGAAVPSRPPEAPPTTLSRRRGGERAVRRSGFARASLRRRHRVPCSAPCGAPVRLVRAVPRLLRHRLLRRGQRVCVQLVERGGRAAPRRDVLHPCPFLVLLRTRQYGAADDTAGYVRAGVRLLLQ